MKYRVAGLLALFSAVSAALAWDYEGHRMVNQVALASLPANFPAFVLTPENKERVAFLAGEPDRWRNLVSAADTPLQHLNNPEHYFDMEDLGDYGLTAETLPGLRYDMTVKLGLARAAHPEKFEPINPEKNRDHTRELLGFLPWAISENYFKLKSEFSYLKTYEQHGGTPAEIANAQANIIYTMGVMGHYVGDGSQPLHATKHHHGWVGDNPQNYTTNRSFHQWIDGGYFEKIGGLKLESLAGKIRPAQSVSGSQQPDGVFHAAVNYLVADEKLVEPLYKLEKEHKLSPHDGEIDPEGLAFMEGRIIAGGQMLGDIWYSAWRDAQEAPEGKYLKDELEKRRAPKVETKAESKAETKPEPEKK